MKNDKAMKGGKAQPKAPDAVAVANRALMELERPKAEAAARRWAAEVLSRVGWLAEAVAEVQLRIVRDARPIEDERASLPSIEVLGSTLSMVALGKLLNQLDEAQQTARQLVHSKFEAGSALFNELNRLDAFVADDPFSI